MNTLVMVMVVVVSRFSMLGMFCLSFFTLALGLGLVLVKLLLLFLNLLVNLANGLRL